MGERETIVQYQILHEKSRLPLTASRHFHAIQKSWEQDYRKLHEKQWGNNNQKSNLYRSIIPRLLDRVFAAFPYTLLYQSILCLLYKCKCSNCTRNVVNIVLPHAFVCPLIKSLSEPVILLQHYVSLYVCVHTD